MPAALIPKGGSVPHPTWTQGQCPAPSRPCRISLRCLEENPRCSSPQSPEGRLGSEVHPQPWVKHRASSAFARGRRKPLSVIHTPGSAGLHDPGRILIHGSAVPTFCRHLSSPGRRLPGDTDPDGSNPAPAEPQRSRGFFPAPFSRQEAKHQILISSNRCSAPPGNGSDCDIQHDEIGRAHV